MRRITTFVVIVAALMQVSLAAHHSSALYDTNKPIEVEGVITSVKWMNPHSRITMDAKDAQGNTVTWVLETVSPAQFASRTPPSLLKPGVKIIAKGPGPRNPGEHILLLMDFDLDGKSYHPGRAGSREGRPGEP